MPVKNEVDILPITLDIISKYCDVIIIADQMSTDGSRDIYKKFPKVRVIDNLREGHSNQVRWDLLKTAREYNGNNLILSLDADEYIPPSLFEKFLNEHEFNIGDSFRFPWIQFWKSIEYYNYTGAWFRNYQRAAWIDDKTTNYGHEVIINDHTSRVPHGFLKRNTRIDSIPIIHLQWVYWEKTQLKQALYRCVELINKPNKYISINSSYALSLDCKSVKLSKVPTMWTEELESLKKVKEFKPTWHLQEIYRLFDKYGILLFEPLQIWHIPELNDQFIKIVGRKPVSIQENIFKRKFRDWKLLLLKLLHY
jgi:hypothetical protein